MIDDEESHNHRMNLLRVSQEQVKARVATEVIRLVDRGSGERECELYRRAVDYLVVYFGGVSDAEYP